MKMLYKIFALTIFYTVFSMSTQNIYEEDKMFIMIGEEVFLISLKQNSLTKELISLLPLKTSIIKETNSSKYLLLPIELETENLITSRDISIKGNIGDLILYKGKEIIILKDSLDLFDNNKDYIKIGFAQQPNELFNSIKNNKSIFLWNNLNYENYQGKVKPYGYYTNLMNYFTWKVFTFFCFLLL